jgi:hypothetical protein
MLGQQTEVSAYGNVQRGSAALAENPGKSLPGTSAVSRSPHNHLAPKEPSGCPAKLRGLVRGGRGPIGDRCAEGQAEPGLQPREVKAVLLWGTWVRWEGLHGYSEACCVLVDICVLACAS